MKRDDEVMHALPALWLGSAGVWKRFRGSAGYAHIQCIHADIHTYIQTYIFTCLHDIYAYRLHIFKDSFTDR